MSIRLLCRNGREFVVDSLRQIFTQALHRDAVDDLQEEATDDQTAGFAFWDTARHQVVHLLVIKTAYSSSVASTGDFTGFDFQVRNCVSTGTVSQQQVAVVSALLS